MTRWDRVERMREDSCVKRCTCMAVNGRFSRHPPNTWDGVLRDNLAVKDFNKIQHWIMQPGNQPLVDPRLTHASMKIAAKKMMMMENQVQCIIVVTVVAPDTDKQ